MMNNTFDILNSKSKFSLGYKSPMNMENKEKSLSALDTAAQYISVLSDVQGKPLISTAKKTADVWV